MEFSLPMHKPKRSTCRLKIVATMHLSDRSMLSVPTILLSLPVRLISSKLGELVAAVSSFYIQFSSLRFHFTTVGVSKFEEVQPFKVLYTSLYL